MSPESISPESRYTEPTLDHLVYATPDLEDTVERLGARLGVSPAPGGSHPGLGTRNALLSLGSECYLEIIGPDPDQPDPGGERPFGIDRLKEPRLVTWAVHGADLDRRLSELAELDLRGDFVSMSRQTPDGRRLEWRLALAMDERAGGTIPFLIDWGSTPSPALETPGGCTLRSLEIEHPSPDSVQPALDVLELGIRVAEGAEPRLCAHLDTPNGPTILY